MKLISPASVTSGSLCDVKEFSFIRFFGANQGNMIIMPQTDGTAFNLFLDGEHQLSGFECSQNDSWAGLIIANPSVTLDLESSYDARREGCRPGDLVRQGEKLFVAMTLKARFGFNDLERILIKDGLPSCGGGEIGFRNWSLDLLVGEETTNLFQRMGHG